MLFHCLGSKKCDFWAKAIAIEERSLGKSMEFHHCFPKRPTKLIFFFLELIICCAVTKPQSVAVLMSGTVGL